MLKSAYYAQRAQGFHAVPALERAKTLLRNYHAAKLRLDVALSALKQVGDYPGDMEASKVAVEKYRKTYNDLCGRIKGPSTLWDRGRGRNGACEDGALWVEDPESYFRLVGRSGTLTERHDGWHTDSYGDGESAEGVVYRLPHNRFVSGMADPCNTDSDRRGPARLNLRRVYAGERPTVHCHPRDCDAVCDASRAGDKMAESYAETEREYQEAYRDGHRAADAFAEHRRRVQDAIAIAKASRPDRQPVREAIADAKAARDACPSLLASACEAMRAALADWRKGLAAYRDAVDEVMCLFEERPARTPEWGFRSYAEPWREGWNEGGYWV